MGTSSRAVGLSRSVSNFSTAFSGLLKLATQMTLSAYIRAHGLGLCGKLQFVLLAFAKALELVPRQIYDNAGLDSTDVLNKLRARHHTGDQNYGVDVDGPEGVRDNMKAFVWEPSLVKLNAISSAAEAACLILSVDETVRNPQSEAVCTALSLLVDLDLLIFLAP